MENLIFSLNIVMPIFILILLGCLIARFGFLTETFFAGAAKLVFYIALPAALFSDVAGSDVSEVFHLRFAVYVVAATVGVALLAWVLARILLREPARIGAAVHGAFRGNFAYVGIPIIHNILNTDTIRSGIMVITFVLPMYNVLAILVLSLCSPAKQRPSALQMALKIIRNPMIIAILAGLPFSAFRIPLPQVAGTAIDYLGQLATPLALLMIGATLKPETFRSKPFDILLSSLIKTVLAPLLTVSIALLLGFSGEELVTIFVLFSVPTAANCYVMTKEMGGDAEAAAGIVMVTALLGVFTMTAGISIMRTLGYI